MKDNKIQPPYLEVTLYSREQDSRTLLKEVIQTLTNNNATLGNSYYAHTGSEIAKKKYASITDELLQKCEIKSLDHLYQIIENDPNKRVIQIELHNITGILSNKLEMVSFVSIPKACIETERHPIAILTEGETLYSNNKKTHKKGMMIYKLAKVLASKIEVDYLSITTEYSLETICALRIDKRSYAFCDFYINNKMLTSDKIRMLESVFKTKHAFSENWENGVYFSTTRNFNPENTGINREDALELSSIVVRSLLNS